MIRTAYHPGGYRQADPAQNRAEQWDSTAGTYTRWNQAGTQVESRPLTPEETAQFTEREAAALVETNGRTVEDKLLNALTVNDTYRALASPTAAQNTAQIKALTREVTGLIKLHLGLLSDTTGT